MYAYILSIRGQIFCMCIIIYIAVTYFSVKRKNTSGHTIFSLLLICSIIYLMFDMITVYTINRFDEISVGFNHFCHIMYMSFMAAAMYLIFMYIRYLTYGEKTFRFYLLIPLCVGILGSIFLSFECVETPYGNYSWGSYAIVPFASAYTYFFIGVYMLIKNRKTMEKKSLHAIAISMTVMLAVAILQGTFPTLLISGIGITMMDFALFYTVESPDAILIEMLEEEKRNADSANRAKSMFLAQMSHDIRTPINAVLGMNEMVLRESNNRQITEYSENIKEAGKTLLSLINSILDFSKIEDGKMELLRVRFSLAEFVNNIVHSISDRAKAKGLELEINVDETLPSEVMGDDVRLTQVISNLMTNAVKYTEKGKVSLNIKKTGWDIEKVRILFSVEDTGVGIKEEDMQSLFDSFHRLEEEKNRKIEGTGLGMAIVCRLLKMMDSEIKVQSTYGVGSVFSFELILDIADVTPIGDYRKHLMLENTVNESMSEGFTAPDAKVLIVDDTPMNLKVAKNLLKIFGIVPDIADSGKKCIELVRKNHYNLIGLDHMMPELSGIETLAQMKAENILSPDTRVIVMTANAIVGAREKYLEAGFEDYVSKPIEVEALKEKLLKFLPKELIIFQQTEPEDKAVTADDDEILEFAPDEESEEDGGQKGSGDLIENLKAAGIDADAGLRYCAGDMTFYRELLEDYVASHTDRIKELNEHLGNAEYKDYQINIHALKSLSKTVGATAISEQAYRLEMAANNGNTDYIRNEHQRFLNDYMETVSRINGAI